MTWPEEVTLACVATVVVVVAAGAAVVVTIGAAVVVVVVVAGAAVVLVVVTTVAGFAVGVVAALGAACPLAGVWLAGDTPELPAARKAGVAEAAGETEGCETEGVFVVSAAAARTSGISAGAAAGAAAADRTTRGTPLPGSTTSGAAAGTVSSTRMVVSG